MEICCCSLANTETCRNCNNRHSIADYNSTNIIKKFEIYRIIDGKLYKIVDNLPHEFTTTTGTNI